MTIYGQVKSLLDGSRYKGSVPFDRKHYNSWYQKHVFRPRRKAEREWLLALEAAKGLE